MKADTNWILEEDKVCILKIWFNGSGSILYNFIFLIMVSISQPKRQIRMTLESDPNV